MEQIQLSQETEIKASGNGNATWVKLLNVGSEIWDGRKMRMMDEQFIKTISSEWRKAQYSFDQIARENGTKPYRFPVKINHQTDGSRKGDIVDVKIKNGALYAKAEWTDVALAAIQSNDYQHVSIGVWPEYSNEKGEKFGPLITEFSITEYPRVQSIGTIQDTMELELSNKEMNMATVTKEEMEKQELEQEKEELEDMAEEREKLKKELEGEEMEASETEKPEDVDPMELMYDKLKKEMMSYIDSKLAPVEEVEEPMEASVVEGDAEAVEVEQSAEEPAEEVTVALSVDAGEASESTKLMLSLIDEVKSLKEMIQTKPVTLKTEEKGFEGSYQVLSDDEKLDLYMSQGMTIGQAVAKLSEDKN